MTAGRPSGEMGDQANAADMRAAADALAAGSVVVVRQGQNWLGIARARSRADLLALPGVDADSLGPTAGDGTLLASLLPPCGLRAHKLLNRLLPGPVAIRLGAQGPWIRRPEHPLWQAVADHREPLLTVCGSGPLPISAALTLTIGIDPDDALIIADGQPMQVLRARDPHRLNEAAAVHLLCVCTGNTCRSPLLATLLQQACQQHGLTTVTVDSAGSHAAEGDPISPNSQECLRARGLDGSRHRSRSIDDLELSLYDRIYCMTPGHEAAVLSYGIPDDRVVLVDPEGIPDPFGGPLAAYESCALVLEAASHRIVETL